MRLPDPLAAYRRWRFRQRCRKFGLTPELADGLSEVASMASEAGEKAAAILAQAISEGRDTCEALCEALDSDATP